MNKILSYLFGTTIGIVLVGLICFKALSAVISPLSIFSNSSGLLFSRADTLCTLPVEQFNKKEIDAEMHKAATDSLQKENEDLKDQLTVAMAASTDDIEKEKAQSIIKDLRSQIRLLEIELKAMTNSRDQFQSENIQLMKQVSMFQKKLKKLEQK